MNYFKCWEHIYFVPRPGRDDVVGFRNYCELLLHNKYFSEGEGSESERIIQKAAGLIMAEISIREMKTERQYPTDGDIGGDGVTFLPPPDFAFEKK